MTQLLPQIKAKWADDNNDPLVGGKVYTYVAGTQTPKTTYTDFGGLTANDNPVILNSRGEADIWLTDGEPYKIVVKDVNDVEIYSVDNITGSGGSGGNISLGTVFVSALDPVAGFLGDKLSAGDNVTLEIITNVGGDSIQINAILDGKILVSATDTTSGYLFDKITSTDGSVIITDNGTSINLALNPAMLGAENLREVSQGSTNATDSAYTMTDTVDVAFLRPDQSDVMRIEHGTAGNATVSVDGQVVAGSADINGTLEADTVNSTGDINATGDIREGGVLLEDKYLQDAPSDGNQYARKDGAWDIVDTQVGVNVDNYAFNFAASVATTVPTNTGVTFGTSLQLYGSAYRSGDAYEVPADGKYRFITRLIYKGLSNGDYTFSIRWRKNGSAISLVDQSVFYLTESSTGTYDHTLEDNMDFECVAGDLITVEIFNNSTSVSSLEFKGNFLGSKIGSVKGEDGAPGAQNLREIGDGSLTTVDSTYTMTAGANVKFVDPLAVDYLTLNDAGVYRQLDLAGELRTERTYIYASDANKQAYSGSPLLIADYRTSNNNSLISGYTETTNSAVVFSRGGGNGAAQAMMTLSDSADTAPYTLQLFPSAGTQIPLDIQHSTGAQVSANFADGILVGDATSGTPGNGTIRYNSNDLQGYVNGQWVSLSKQGESTTLADVGDNSIDATDSTYTLKNGVNVKFEDSTNAKILELNETKGYVDAPYYNVDPAAFGTFADYAQYMQIRGISIDSAGDPVVNSNLLNIVNRDTTATQPTLNISNLSLGKSLDIDQDNADYAINVTQDGTGAGMVIDHNGGVGSDNAVVVLGNTNQSHAIDARGGSESSGYFENGVTVGNNTTGTTNGTIRHTGTDIEGLISGVWTSLSQGGASGGQVDSVVAGDGISVDATDPVNPIVTNADHQTTLDTISGTQIQEFSLTLIKDTGSWYVECEQNGGGDLDIIIGGVEKTLICTPSKARSVAALTLGSSTVPSIQYVWIELNAGTPEIHVGTSVDRSAPFVLLGVYRLLDDTFTTSDGAFYYQRFNNASNHGVEGRSLLEEIAERVRVEGLKIFRGCEGSTVITTNPAALDGLELGVTAGVIYQLHQQSVSAQTPPNDYFVVNDSVSPYKKITNLNQITLDANGDSLFVNGRWYGLDFAISQNSESGATRIYVFLPTGSYAAKADAVNDLYGYSGIAMPIEEQSSVVRMCRMVVGYTNAASGTFTNALTGTATQDQRNFPIGTTGGGTSGGNDFTKYPYIPQTTVPVPVTEGTTYYDANKHNLIVQSGGDVNLDVGREQWIRGYNNTGSTITNGTPVYLNNGTTEGSVTVADIELANSSAKSTCTFVGIVTEDIATGTYGEVTIHGMVKDMDTSGFSNGDILYVSTTSGNLVATPPAFPNYECKIGKVLNVSATEGVVYVAPDVDPPQGSGGIVQAGIQTFPICDITDLYTNSVATNQSWTIGTVVIPTANIEVNYMSCFVTQVGTNQGCRMGIYSPGSSQDTLLGQTVYYSSTLVAGINTWAMESPVTLFANTPYLLMLQASTNGTIFGWRDNITNSNGGIQTNRPNHMAVFDYSNNSNPSAGMESPGTRSSSSSRIWLACS